MHDALARIVEPDQPDAVLGRIVRELLDHPADLRSRQVAGAPPGRHVVVGDAECELGMRDRRPALRQLVEGVERPFVQQMPVDPQQCLPVLAGQNGVAVPQLVDDGAGRFAHR